MNGRYQYEKAASTILIWLHLAEIDLVGHVVTTTYGEAGTVKAIRLDESHGLCFSFELDDNHLKLDGAQRWYPVSIIKMHGPKA